MASRDSSHGTLPLRSNKIDGENDVSMNHYLIFQENAGPQKISQIDLVPTISLLLGIPIPFSNLGMVIPELFTLPSTSELEEAVGTKPSVHPLHRAVKAMQINALQV